MTASWLELLLRDAPADELEEHRRALVDAGTPADVADRDARQALQLHVQLRERARRATELAALSQMAARLAVVRDLSALLSDVAGQARSLLRTDVAYLALVEDDAMRIRYFDGVLGAAAREIRLSLEAGLAGRVVTTGQAAWTTDYLADTTIEHLPQADSFAVDEGLRSILGVPLQAHGRVLGVLFAAERAQRPFTPSEISLLGGLAGHAAVAIENAELFETERATADELRATNSRLQDSNAAVDRAVVLHERLTDAVVRGGGPAEVVLALSEVLQAPVQLVDAEDRLLAGPDLGVAPAERFATGERRTAVVEGESGGVLVLCPVVAAEDYLGSIVVSRPGAPDDAEVRLLERGALGIALSLVQQRALTEAANHSRGELLTALVEGGEAEVLERRAAGLRIDLRRREHVLALVDSGAPAGRSACAELAQRTGGLVADRAGRVLLLVPAGTDLSSLAPAATVGVSPPARGAAALPEAYAAARRCLQAALALGRTGIVATPDALGVYRFLLGASAPDEAAAFVARVVGPLLDHDTSRGTDLARTLEAYLSSGRQHTATAEALHIHPNTLYQRLGRITTVLGEDWREPDTALDLHVALRLHRLAGVLGPPR